MVFHGKLKRRGHHRHDEIKLLAGIPASKRFCEVVLVRLLVEPRIFQIDDREVHRVRKTGPQRGLHLIDRHTSASTGEDQHVLCFCLRRGRRSKRQEDEDQDRKAPMHRLSMPAFGSGWKPVRQSTDVHRHAAFLSQRSQEKGEGSGLFSLLI